MARIIVVNLCSKRLWIACMRGPSFGRPGGLHSRRRGTAPPAGTGSVEVSIPYRPGTVNPPAEGSRPSFRSPEGAKHHSGECDLSGPAVGSRKGSGDGSPLATTQMGWAYVQR